jgi:polar amino acid transport system substrate-binding protein
MKLLNLPLYIIQLFLFCLSFAVLGCDNGKAVISGDTSYPPLSWNSNKGLEGSLVSLAHKIFAEVGIETQTDGGGPWKRVLYRAEHGEVDLLLGVRKTEELASSLHYIEPPISPAVHSIFVLKDSKLNFQRWEDLIGLTGNITLGSNFNTQFDDFMKANLSMEYTETIEQGIQKLLNHRVDYLLGPRVTYALIMKKENRLDSIRRERKPLILIDEYFAIPKKSSCAKYVTHFSQRLKAMLESGELDTLLEEQFINWFQQNSNQDSLN